MKINIAVASAFAHIHQSPAKMARDLLASHTDLEDGPFGQILSMLAQGKDLPLSAPPTKSTETPSEAIAVQSGKGIHFLA